MYGLQRGQDVHLPSLFSFGERRHLKELSSYQIARAAKACLYRDPCPARLVKYGFVELAFSPIIYCCMSPIKHRQCGIHLNFLPFKNFLGEGKRNYLFSVFFL
jgi:hypothetical protein